jgi:hypothetical protein
MSKYEAELKHRLANARENYDEREIEATALWYLQRILPTSSSGRTCRRLRCNS